MPYWFTEYHTPSRGLTFEVSDLLYKETSPYQTIEILCTPDFGTVMLLDGVVMVADYDEYVYHEMLTQPALFTHPHPKQVLIIGGGDGGTLKRVLMHPGVERAVLVEIDEMVVRISKQYFPSLAEAFDHPKAEVLIEDGIAYLKENKEQFDVILIDSTDPVGPAEGLFTEAFYRDCYAALKSDGILTIQSESPWIPHLKPIIKQVHDILTDIFPSVYPYTAAIQTYQAGLWLFQMASKQYSPYKVADKTRYQGKEFGYYNQALHTGCFALPQFIINLLNQQA